MINKKIDKNSKLFVCKCKTPMEKRDAMECVCKICVDCFKKNKKECLSVCGKCDNFCRNCDNKLRKQMREELIKMKAKNRRL